MSGRGASRMLVLFVGLSAAVIGLSTLTMIAAAWPTHQWRTR